MCYLYNNTSKSFDIARVHPNILKPILDWQNYCAKDKEFISIFYERDAFATATQMDNSSTAVQYVWKKRRREMCLHGSNIESNLEK